VLRAANRESFNRVSVDAEMSTSDMALLFASGKAGNSALRSRRSPGADVFEEAVGEVCGELARAIARDGEGATKLLTVEVTGAKTPRDAESAA
ncbi:MAG: bifunctional ornithine acetyltransferase/N-acetylglutamate synthase, partial [Gemmatimonadetes bacterium]|nr:bifunctional ornithine acetyltransferase/N-acetylglutamate synthase [Gemmatimonadota bacterium]